MILTSSDWFIIIW